MPPQALSSKFTDAIDGLPDEVQLRLLKKHISTFLDSAPEEAAKKTLQHVNKTKTRYEFMPKILLSSRRTEIQNLLEQVERDQKKVSAFPPGVLTGGTGPSTEELSTKRDELLEEVIHTMAGWFQDIWSAVAEYNAGYSEAHASLIYCTKTITEILDSPPPSRCKCATNLMTVNVTFRRRCSKPGKLVKQFAETGIDHMYTVIFWLWRELLVSAIANESSNEVVEEYLIDIEHAMSWKSLQRVLNGGTAAAEREDDYEDVDEDDDDDDGPTLSMDDLESETEADENSPPDQLPKHWPARFKTAFPAFAGGIQARLQAIFSLEPSHDLYRAIQNMTTSHLRESSANIRKELRASLDNVATSTTSTMLAALDIYTHQHLPSKISNLLSSHSYLLRPQDFTVYQSATMVLVTHQPSASQALKIIETELFDTVQAIRYAVIQCFSDIEKPRSKHELAQILKLKSTSLDRKDLVERWVESILTPGTTLNGPMALAAVMMGVGFPFPGVTPLDLQDSDPLSFIDPESVNDPEYEALREEYRPNLAERLDGWIRICGGLDKAPEMLMDVYKRVVEIIPWIRGPDIIEELVTKIGGRQTKHYLCDALESLNVFAKTQRRKILTLQKKNKTQKGTGSTSASHTHSTSAPSSTNPPPPFSPPASNAQPQLFPFGFQLPIPFTVNAPAGVNPFAFDGGEDSDSDDDGPPSLEPIGIAHSGASTSATHNMHVDDDGPPPLEPVGLVASSHAAPSGSQASFDDEPPPLEPVSDSSDEYDDDYEDTDDSEDYEEDEDDVDDDEDDDDVYYGMPPPLIPIHPTTGNPFTQSQAGAPPPPPAPQQNLPPMPPPGTLLLPFLPGLFGLPVPGGPGGMNDVD